jgi:arginase
VSGALPVDLLLVPYDSAHRGARLGAGPEHLVAAGLGDELARAGHPVARTVLIEPPDGRVAEIRTAFELMRGLSVAVSAARASRHFPLVLAGNCNTCLGTVAGLGGGQRTAVLWFDAHGDFNTPETTTSAFLDGMALAMLNGRCWSRLARTVPGFSPVAERATCLLGARDLDPLEAEAIAGSALRVLPPARIPTDLATVLADLPPDLTRAYLHVDLDVLDPSEGRANEFSADGGLSLAGLQEAIRAIGRALPIHAAAITAYDPQLDGDGRIRAAATTIARTIVAASG